MGFWKKILAVVVGAACAATAAAHGFLAEPKARNVIANSNYCPHCLAAGGPGMTYAGGRVWPNALHGVCGDPHAGPLDHEAGGKFATGAVAARYVRGQRITIRVRITAPHGGRFSFGLCPVPDGAGDAAERAAVTQRCLDANKLTNVEDGTPYWWFGKKPVGEYAMDFRLPPAVTCKRCVLQWHYETGNSCNIPGTPAQHLMSPGMTPCNQSPNMEEFWNCADVSIADGEGGQDAEPPATAKKKAGKKAAARPRRRRRERFAPYYGGPAATAGGGSAAQDIAVAALVLAVVALALPPLLALVAGGAAGTWYLVRRYGHLVPVLRVRPRGGGPRPAAALPAPPPAAWALPRTLPRALPRQKIKIRAD
jgi:hypothetical protein